MDRNDGEMGTVKKLFQAIRQGDLETVKELLDKKPELIGCTAKQPPKKDDGQSPLQVALKTGNFEIAEYLLMLHADVNFMESKDCADEWRAPVIHDAINAAVMNSRWNVNSEIYGGVKVFHSKDVQFYADRHGEAHPYMQALFADLCGKQTECDLLQPAVQE